MLLMADLISTILMESDSAILIQPAASGTKVGILLMKLYVHAHNFVIPLGISLTCSYGAFCVYNR